jgi:asparagine synthase (glutamine-hydrolysing)
MHGMVPEKIRNRQDKIGFETPEMEWFRKPLCPYISGILNAEGFNNRPYWDSDRVRKMYDNVLKRKNNNNHIWRFLSVELWLQTFIEGREMNPAQ